MSQHYHFLNVQGHAILFIYRHVYATHIYKNQSKLFSLLKSLRSIYVNRLSEKIFVQGFVIIHMFFLYPWGELNTHLFLNTKIVNEQCIGQRPTTKNGSTRSLQRCNMSITYCRFIVNNSRCKSIIHIIFLKILIFFLANYWLSAHSRSRRNVCSAILLLFVCAWIINL